ncbi:MAG TPA: hypothetical protein VFG47_22325 [Geminicoccaceae bacterium]|nr:hypothetical protein [Geminicoccaceae bacterium]
MPTARQLVRLLLQHTGEKYKWGLASIPKENAGYKGPWDCAEFVAWGIYQVTGQYVGCRGRNHNAYTGYFADDLPRFGTELPEEEAVELIGAIALRKARAGRVGHIAVCRGGGRTIEAASTRLGVCSLDMRGRGFERYYTLNSLTYEYMCAFV